MEKFKKEYVYEKVYEGICFWYSLSRNMCMGKFKKEYVYGKV